MDVRACLGLFPFGVRARAWVVVCDLIGLDGTSGLYSTRNKPGSGPELQGSTLFFFYVFCFSHQRSHRQAAQHTAAQRWRQPNDHMRAFTKTHVPQSQKYALMARSVKAASGALLPSPTPLTPTTPHHTTSLFLYTRGRVSVFVTPSVFFGHVSCQNKSGGET